MCDYFFTTGGLGVVFSALVTIVERVFSETYFNSLVSNLLLELVFLDISSPPFKRHINRCVFFSYFFKNIPD